MAYCTKQDIENQITAERLVQLADDDNDGVADTAVVEDAIATATDEVDSYLRVRYSVPLETVPKKIMAVAREIAIYYLRQRRPETMTERDKVPYDEAIDFLKSISAGKAGIDIGDSPDVVEKDLPASNKLNEEGTFSSGGSGLNDF